MAVQILRTSVNGVINWREANALLEHVVAGRRYTFGTGYTYNDPLAVFYLNCGLSGYDVWETKDGKIHQRIATIFAGG